ncbi:MAG TPA: chemotaxis protein CheW [Anaeromyxobacteraceae bacterium]|nr:chemotaxis protein CheW [Anaeromyxobacteraceae bacterium]
MDFLEIRRKAKERAEARAAAGSEAGAGPAGPEDAPAPPSGASPAAAPADAPPSDAASPDAPEPVLTRADVLEGDLAATLQGAQTGPFRTWRPDQASAPPAPLPEEPADPPGHRRREALRQRRATPADPLDEFFHSPDEEGPPVEGLGAPEASAVAARRPADDVEEYLTFRLSGEKYGISIGAVREVIQAPPITEVPRAPAAVLGVVTVRGEVVAVIDPRRRLGLPHRWPAEGEGKVVIVDAGDGPCGLHVDRVASVVRLRPGSIEPCPQGISGQRAEFLAGIGREGERLFTVLDLGALLRRATPRAGARAGRADA